MERVYGLIASLFLGWALGANDTANSFGTAVAARLVRLSRATLLMAAFVMLGALLEGRKCFVTVEALSVGGMLAASVATFSAASVVATMTYFGLPVSSTQCMVGALIGVALLRGLLNVAVLCKVAVAWLVTPVLALALAYLVHRALTPLFLKVLSVREFHSVMQGLVVLFGCYGAYTLGANNLANVVGPAVASKAISPLWGQLLGGAAIAMGALTYSRKVIETVGGGIIPMDAFSAFVAVFSHALVLHICTWLGVPTSSSQAMVGAVIGVGMVYGVRMVNRRLVAFILGGWAVAFTISGLMAALMGTIVGAL